MRATGGAVMVAALALGCGLGAADFVTGPAPPGAPEAVSRVEDGLLYRAEFLLLREDALEIQVTIENRGSAVRRVSYSDDCVALIRAYWETGAVAWDQRDGKSRCLEEVREVVIPPRGAETFRVRASALTILGSASSGRVEIAAYARPVGSPEVELVLGTVPLSFP